MTPTEERVGLACLEDRCEQIANGREENGRCGHPRENHYAADSSNPSCDACANEGRGGNFDSFVPHTHSRECDAEFWRAMGCLVEIGIGLDNRAEIVACVSDDDEHLQRWHRVYRQLAPILSAPSSDGARLAAFDVLAEVERRGWSLRVELNAVKFSIDEWHFIHIARYDSIDTLPAAIALAAYRAREEG